MIPIVTSAGNTLGWLVGGVVITEQIFSIPGLGMYMVAAINQRDYPVVQGGVLYRSAHQGTVQDGKEVRGITWHEKKS